MKKEFPLITIQGDAFNKGHEYGEKCKSLIDLRMSTLRSLFDSQDYFGVSWEKAIEKAKGYHHYIEKYAPHIVEEMRGIAVGADRTYDVIVFLNAVYEFFSLKVDGVWNGCTTASALPEITKEKNTIIGQNDDWNEIFQKASILLRIEQKSGPDILQFTEAGTVGGNGINSAGIGLCANSLQSSGWSVNGVPHLILKRGILNSTNFSNAIRAVSSAKRCSSHNYLITHIDGECIDIETTPYTANFIFPDRGFLTHTNHFVVTNSEITDNKVSRSPNTLIRKHRADKILSGETGSVSVDTFRRMFTDHFSKPHSICRHPDLERHKLHQMQTNASMIIDMTNSKMIISHGPPCLGGYEEVDIWSS
ncbi:MAG: C45 family peptidase [Candidatus Thorarchaeota archaeon]